MNELTNTFRANFINDLDAGRATEVEGAAFCQGDEDEIRTTFYRLWDRVVRAVENRRDTTTRFFFVNGENLDLFNAHYPNR